MTNNLATQIVTSYSRHCGRLLPGVEFGGDLYKAVQALPYPVLAHTNDPDPVFYFANDAALTIFEYPLSEFIGLPSRLSAEPGLREERAKLMEEVRVKGYADSYKGIRVSKSGKRFEITNATIWNVEDEAGSFIGQAAALFEWRAVIC